MFRNPTRMKRLMAPSVMIAVAWGWSGDQSVRAQPPAAKAPPTQGKGDSQETPNRQRDRRSNAPRDVLDKLQKLRLAMPKELGLSPEQRDIVETLFKDHFKIAPERYAEDMRQKQEQLQTQAEKIRAEMDEAAKRGDADQARRLRKAHAELYRNAFRADIDATAQLLIALRDSLDAPQQKKFDALLRKLRLSFAGAPAHGMSPIGEQLRNPELGITDEQRETIDRLTKEAMSQLGAPDLQPAARREILFQLREDILAQLTDEQNRRIEEDMERYRERRRQREEALEQLRKQKEAAQPKDGPSAGDHKHDDPSIDGRTAHHSAPPPSRGL